MSIRTKSDPKNLDPTASWKSQPGSIGLRPMVETDLWAVVGIEHDAYSFPWSEGIFRDCLRVGYCCWVLEYLDVVEGYGIMSVGVGESHILNLCIRPRVQGKGLGRNLLKHLMSVAREHHAQTIMLEVRPTNPSAIRLYHGMGFNEAGVRRAYYPSDTGREDALIFAMEL